MRTSQPDHCTYGTRARLSPSHGRLDTQGRVPSPERQLVDILPVQFLPSESFTLSSALSYFAITEAFRFGHL